MKTETVLAVRHANGTTSIVRFMGNTKDTLCGVDQSCAFVELVRIHPPTNRRRTRRRKARCETQSHPR